MPHIQVTLKGNLLDINDTVNYQNESFCKLQLFADKWSLIHLMIPCSVLASTYGHLQCSLYSTSY